MIKRPLTGRCPPAREEKPDWHPRLEKRQTRLKKKPARLKKRYEVEKKTHKVEKKTCPYII